jgi:hypothetical protein
VAVVLELEELAERALVEVVGISKRRPEAIDDHPLIADHLVDVVVLAGCQETLQIGEAIGRH